MFTKSFCTVISAIIKLAMLMRNLSNGAIDSRTGENSRIAREKRDKTQNVKRDRRNDRERPTHYGNKLISGRYHCAEVVFGR